MPRREHPGRARPNDRSAAKSPVYGVMGEDDSDVAAVTMFITRLREAAKKQPKDITIHRMGYGGCAKMLRKGAAQLSTWADARVTRAVVCYDADRDLPADRLTRLQQLVADSGVKIACGLVVPVQELEAWFLADVAKLLDIFSSLRKAGQVPAPVESPELVNDPKEALVRLSRHPVRREAQYYPPTHNVRMAELVDLAVVKRKCPSFDKLVAFVNNE